MCRFARSAFLLALFSGPLIAGPASADMGVASAPTAEALARPTANAACAAPARRVAQASAVEADQGRPAVTDSSADSAPAAVAADPSDNVCRELALAAGENDLPLDFFTRLIWQESRFDPAAVSRAGAQGVAQFMPATAIWRGLEDPFDPVEAIAKSAQLLRDLRGEFGNLGLAAAAYNAGSGRVRDWLAGRRGLPSETRAYVRIVTGRSAEEWTGVEANLPETRVPVGVPCRQIATFFVARASHAAAPRAKPRDPWGVQLVGSSSEAMALAAYRQMQKRYASVLAGRDPHLVRHGRAPGTMGWARISVGAESRATAERLCASLRAAGGSCHVQRN
jgi:hypothetical protein